MYAYEHVCMYISIYLHTFKDTVKFSKDPVPLQATGCWWKCRNVPVPMPRPREYTWVKAPGRHVLVFAGAMDTVNFRIFFYMRRLEHRMKLIHSQIFLLICGRVPSGVVSHSRCLFMEGRKTTLRIIKLEHATLLYRRLVLKQFGTSMMMWDEIDLDLLVFHDICM